MRCARHHRPAHSGMGRRSSNATRLPALAYLFCWLRPQAKLSTRRAQRCNGKLRGRRNESTEHTSDVASRRSANMAAALLLRSLPLKRTRAPQWFRRKATQIHSAAFARFPSESSELRGGGGLQRIRPSTCISYIYVVAALQEEEGIFG